MMVIATFQHSLGSNSHTVHDPAGSQVGSCCCPRHGAGMAMARNLFWWADMSFHPSSQVPNHLMVLRAAKQVPGRKVPH